MSRTLTPCECRYRIIEKEAASIIEAVRKWNHYLYGRPFTLITDQRSLALMFDQTSRGKIKNAKIQAWRAELSLFSGVLQAPRPSPISLNHFLVLQFDHLTMNMKFWGISLMFTSATEAILRPTF